MSQINIELTYDQRNDYYNRITNNIFDNCIYVGCENKKSRFISRKYLAQAICVDHYHIECEQFGLITNMKKTIKSRKCTYNQCDRKNVRYRSRAFPGRKMCKYHYEQECEKLGPVYQVKASFPKILGVNPNSDFCAYEKCTIKSVVRSRLDKTKKVCAVHYSRERRDIQINQLKEYVVKNFNNTTITKCNFSRKILLESVKFDK